MNQLFGEVLIVHGAGLTPQEELTEKATARMDTAMYAHDEGVAPNVVVSGGHSFLLSEIPALSEAAVMKRYAIERGIQEEKIFTEERSLETVGNALFTKTDIVIPRGWTHLVVVTSESHLPRTLKIFKHVYGNDFNIDGIPAPEKIGSKERIWEALGSAMVNEILRGTKQGDDEAVKERLLNLVPGYGEATLPRLAAKNLLGLARKRI